MKRIFLLGDFVTDSGPAIANRKIEKSLGMKYRVTSSKQCKKIKRIIELISGIRGCDLCMLTSKSMINYVAIVMTKIFNKKLAYIVHGLSSYELDANESRVSVRQRNKIIKYEKIIFENSDKIICVSKLLMKYVQQQYPTYNRKIDYIYNCVDVEKVSTNVIRDSKILSVGGGVRQKANLSVAASVWQLNNKLDYYVVGKSDGDGESIQEYANVKWFEHMSHTELLNLMESSYLYIQNSRFETFGIAIIEALYSGCNILMSENIGCKELFTNLTNDDVIYDVDDIDEISEKISRIYINGNNDRLMKGFQSEKITLEWQANKFEKIITEIL